MRQGQVTRSRVRHKRAVGYIVSPYRQKGGTIMGLDATTRRVLADIQYPWQLKGRKKSIKRKRKR